MSALLCLWWLSSFRLLYYWAPFTWLRFYLQPQLFQRLYTILWQYLSHGSHVSQLAGKKTLCVCVCTSVSTGKLDVCNVLGGKTQTKQSHNHIFRHVRMHMYRYVTMLVWNVNVRASQFFLLLQYVQGFVTFVSRTVNWGSLNPWSLWSFCISCLWEGLNTLHFNNLKVYLALIVLTSLINPSLTDSWWETRLIVTLLFQN